MPRLLVATGIVCVGLLSCRTETGAARESQEAQEPAPEATLTEVPSCPEGQWLIETESNHSTIGFSVPIMGGLTTVTGKFMNWQCFICYDEQDVTRGSVLLAVDMKSVDTGILERDADLQGSEFFDSARLPVMTFRSQRIVMNDDGYVAVGELQIKGIAHEIELPFVVTGSGRDEDTGGPIIGVAVSYTLNRHDFQVGSDWIHTAIPDFLGDSVAVQAFVYGWGSRD